MLRSASRRWDRRQRTANRISRSRVPIGKAAQPTLVNGPATLSITAARAGVLRPAHRSTTVTRDRAGAPRSAACGGPVAAPLHQPRRRGVRRPSGHAAGRAGRRARRRRRVSGLSGTRGRPRDPAVRVAFFALRHDQDVNTTISAFARDEAGNQASTPVEHRPFPKAFVRSKIPDRPALPRSRGAGDCRRDARPEGGHQSSPEGLLQGFLTINGELRKKNGDTIRGLAAKTKPRDAVARSVRPDGQHAGGVAVRRSAHLLLRRQGDRPAGAPGLRPRVGPACTGARRQHRHRRVRRLPRHLRQLRHRRPRPGRAVALRAPVVDRREAGRPGGERRGARAHRRHRPRRRRPPALHDAAAGHAGEPRRVVGQPLDGGPRAAEDQRSGAGTT